MTYRLAEELELKLLNGTKQKEANDFKYLGSWVDSTEEDMRIRKGLVVTHKIHERRVRFAGHNTRQAGTPLSKLILWEPTHGRASRRRRASRGRPVSRRWRASRGRPASRRRPALCYVEFHKSVAGVTDTDG